MPTKKKAAAKTTADKPRDLNEVAQEDLDRLKNASREPVVQPKDTRAPHEINSSLSSPRMKALLKDHQAMGSRPK